MFYDPATLRDFLHTITGPIILVGHSYGGSVITNAATGDPEVKAPHFRTRRKANPAPWGKPFPVPPRSYPGTGCPGNGLAVTRSPSSSHAPDQLGRVDEAVGESPLVVVPAEDVYVAPLDNLREQGVEDA